MPRPHGSIDPILLGHPLPAPPHACARTALLPAPVRGPRSRQRQPRLVPQAAVRHTSTALHASRATRASHGHGYQSNCRSGDGTLSECPPISTPSLAAPRATSPAPSVPSPSVFSAPYVRVRSHRHVSSDPVDRGLRIRIQMCDQRERIICYQQPTNQPYLPRMRRGPQRAWKPGTTSDVDVDAANRNK